MNKIKLKYLEYIRGNLGVIVSEDSFNNGLYLVLINDGECDCFAFLWG